MASWQRDVVVNSLARGVREYSSPFPSHILLPLMPPARVLLFKGSLGVRSKWAQSFVCRYSPKTRPIRFFFFLGGGVGGGGLESCIGVWCYW